MKAFSNFRLLPRIASRRQFLLSGLAMILAGSRLSQAQAAQSMLRTPSSPKAAGERKIVMLDPGHGGIDPGAVGHQGAKEKHVVLEIAHSVRDCLRETPNIEVRMTREDDYFIPLYRRVEIAHEHRADLFVSIHADGYTNAAASGASVFALSNRGASSAMARYMSQRENDADRIAGAQYAEKDNDYLQQVLFDLVQTDTIKNGLMLGNHVLDHIRSVHRLHSGETEQAAFAVLKSPSVPSVLVETSFITNHQEEKLLSTSAFRQEIARAIAGGIVKYIDYFNANERRRPG